MPARKRNAGDEEEQEELVSLPEDGSDEKEAEYVLSICLKFEAETLESLN